MSNSTVSDSNTNTTALYSKIEGRPGMCWGKFQLNPANFSKIEGRPGMCWGKFQLNPANFSKIEGQLRSVSDFLK
jgi:hypothetical protein